MNEVMSACGLESKPRWLIWERHGQWDRIECSNCGEQFKKKVIPETCSNCKSLMTGGLCYLT